MNYWKKKFEFDFSQKKQHCMDSSHCAFIKKQTLVYFNENIFNKYIYQTKNQTFSDNK